MNALSVLLVGIGGGVGSVLRFVLGQWMHRLSVHAQWLALPWGTLLVNLVGCLAIGALSVILARPLPLAHEWRVLLMTGLLGGFTTFSAFGLELWQLLHTQQWWQAALYSGVSVGLGVLAVGFGVWWVSH